WQHQQQQQALKAEQTSRGGNVLVPILENGLFSADQKELTGQDQGGINEAAPINLGGSSPESPSDSRTWLDQKSEEERQTMELQAKVQEQLQKPKEGNNASNNLDHHSSQSTSSIVDQHHNNISKSNRSAAAAVVEVDVKIIGSEAMICVQTPNQDYPYAKG
ncbi:hypothetical protein DVH24_003698, partial [Malus domestica]